MCEYIAVMEYSEMHMSQSKYIKSRLCSTYLLPILNYYWKAKKDLFDSLMGLSLSFTMKQLLCLKCFFLRDSFINLVTELIHNRGAQTVQELIFNYINGFTMDL